MRLNGFQIGSWVEYCDKYYKLTYLSEYTEECIIEHGEETVNLIGHELAEIRPILIYEDVLYSIYTNRIELPQGGAMAAFCKIIKDLHSGAFSAYFYAFDKAVGSLTIRPKSKNPYELRIKSTTGEYCKIKTSVLFLHEFQSILKTFGFDDLADGLNPDDSLVLAMTEKLHAIGEAKKLLPENKTNDRKEESI